MAIDPQRMAAIMQSMKMAAPAGAPLGGGMMAQPGGAPGGQQGTGGVNAKISGTVIMAPAEGQQGGPPSPVQLNGTIRMSKPAVGGPPNLVHIEGDVLIAKPGGQPGAAPGGPAPGGPAPGMAPQGMAPQGMPPR
jgi:hypothetical protein